jgi:hypothetical protein
MNIQTQKINLARMILETDNPTILESVKKLFAKSQKADCWDSLSVSQKAEIENGISEIDKGEVIDYESIMTRHRK